MLIDDPFPVRHDSELLVVYRHIGFILSFRQRNKSVSARRSCSNKWIKRE
jgi:hypothetical protein